jgi:hypothetical protein
MKCVGCTDSSEGFAVIPGVGDAGEIRFYCDRCARRDRVKMRYWDGRDLDIGGHRDDPDLGRSFQTLVLGFEDVARMRVQDIALVLDWLEDGEVAGALVGAPQATHQRVLSALRADRQKRVREMLSTGRGLKDPSESRACFVQTVRKL